MSALVRSLPEGQLECVVIDFFWSPEDELPVCWSSCRELMTLIGSEIGKLHLADIVHGDLTTSNMMLRDRVANTPAQLVSPSILMFWLNLNMLQVPAGSTW